MQTRFWRWVAALALVLASSSCATGSDLSPVGTPSADPLTAPATAPTSHPGVIVVTPQPAVTVTPPPEQVRTSIPWTLQELSTDGRQATIGYQSGGGCTTATGVEVTQSSTGVQLTVWGETSGHFSCTTQLQHSSVVVILDPPLGSRALLHAPVSRRFATPAN